MRRGRYPDRPRTQPDLSRTSLAGSVNGHHQEAHCSGVDSPIWLSDDANATDA
jgi:hypothetical protein